MLSDPERLREEIEKLPPVERKLLETIEAGGGEVDTQELLDLEREPLRLRGAGGVTATRRGAGFSLERRAFLIPIHPNRHVIPTEVAQIVGADRRRPREARRAADPHLRPRGGPRPPPRPLRLRPGLPRGGHGRSACASPAARCAPAWARRARSCSSSRQRFGRDVEAVALLAAALARRRPVGLRPRPRRPRPRARWRCTSSPSCSSPPGAAAAPGTRPAPSARCSASPRAAATPAPSAPCARWSSTPSRTSARGAGCPGTRSRATSPPTSASPASSACSAAGPSAPASSRPTSSPPPAASRSRRCPPSASSISAAAPRRSPPAGHPTVRLTPRGRSLLAAAKPTIDPTPSKFIDTHALRVGQSRQDRPRPRARASSPSSGASAISSTCSSRPQAIARALSVGVESDSLRARIELVAPLPDTISRMLIQASAVIGRGSLVQASGFLWIDDPEVRELLRTRRPASELFVDPVAPRRAPRLPRRRHRARGAPLPRARRRGRGRGRRRPRALPHHPASRAASPPPAPAAPRRPSREHPAACARPQRGRGGAPAPAPRGSRATPAEGLKRTKR